VNTGDPAATTLFCSQSTRPGRIREAHSPNGDPFLGNPPERARLDARPPKRAEVIVRSAAFVVAAELRREDRRRVDRVSRRVGPWRRHRGRKLVDTIARRIDDAIAGISTSCATARRSPRRADRW
jgi:hypothetical protein